MPVSRLRSHSNVSHLIQTLDSEPISHSTRNTAIEITPRQRLVPIVGLARERHVLAFLLAGREGLQRFFVHRFVGLLHQLAKALGR